MQSSPDYSRKHAQSKSPSFSPNRRFFVPDLSPLDRPLLKSATMAGRVWWTMLAEILGENDEVDLSAESLQHFCRKYKIAILNAVQYPLDPKVAKRFPEADPVSNLGFQKATGPYSFKKQRPNECVQTCIQSLAARVRHSSLAGAKVYCLGNDAQWFLGHALGPYPEDFQRFVDKIPHPSAWWRQGGYFGRVAHEKLSQIFAS
ncbi:MAG: hypothetical protein HYX41_02645 [Bdellovibrio sp.]|nr:hypothetical protein [Bdellovibrio sp.]